MNFLIITQKIDKEDDLLGFFHGWVNEFSKHFEKINVICLSKGKCELPHNVEVFSLGKEETANVFQKRLRYIFRFYKYIRKLRKDYDQVFVHMNKEYVILGGVFWKMWNKKISLWYNHSFGNFWSSIAGILADQIFFTSPYSFFSKEKKAKKMPVGIDTHIFKTIDTTQRKPNSLLYIGRIAPVKNLHLLIEACNLLKQERSDFLLTITGDPGENDHDYHQNILKMIEEYNLKDNVIFTGKIPNYKTPELYNQNEICINLTNSGSMDKTIFEAMACGAIPLVSNQSFKNLFPEQLKYLIFEPENSKDLAGKIKYIFSISEEKKKEVFAELNQIVLKNDLYGMVKKILESIKI